VIVVELYAEHRVGQGLDHLALEFDLVFLCHSAKPTSALAIKRGAELVGGGSAGRSAAATGRGRGRFARGGGMRSGRS
jgi:hypothetical protein